MTELAANFFKGIAIGVSNIIPGVSGGTIAVALGIFDRLIGAVNGIFRHFRQHAAFLAMIGLGAAAGILALSSAIEYSLENFSFPTCMFFAGLVAGSIPLIWKKASQKPYKKSVLAAAPLAALFVAALALMRTPETADTQAAVNAAMMIRIFFGGAAAAASMLIPGISGSFVLLLFGIYPAVIRHISYITDYLRRPGDTALLLDIGLVLAPLGIGIIIGLLLVSKIIGFLLKKAYSPTYFTILGLSCGSVFALFIDPVTYQSGVQISDIFIGAGALITGAAAALKFGADKH